MDFFFFFYNNDIQIHKSYISQPSDVVMEIIYVTRTQYFLYCFFYTILKRKLQHITIFYILHIIFTSSFYSKRKINRWDLSADIVGSWKCFFQSGENRYWINAVWKTWGCEGAGPIVVGPSASPFMDWPFSYYRLLWSNNIQSITL